jgi:hypothetical protein
MQVRSRQDGISLYEVERIATSGFAGAFPYTALALREWPTEKRLPTGLINGTMARTWHTKTS